MKPRQTEQPRVQLPSGATLRGTLSFSGEPGSAAVLYVHGFGSVRGGSKAAALEGACARRGWTFAAFDFRGHGESGGTTIDARGSTLLDLRGSGLQEDLEMVRAYLASRGVRWLFPVGSSMGGWAAAWFARRQRDVVPACVGVAPAFDFLGGRWARLSDAERESWRRTGRLWVRNEFIDVEIGYGLMDEADQFRVSDLAAAWTTPLLVYHGMRDATVTWSDTLAFVERVECADVELRLLKDGDHRLLHYQHEIAEAACDFFTRWWHKGA
jgi:pimeloyl-ACP methyl ester carboxylesterase